MKIVPARIRSVSIAIGLTYGPYLVGSAILLVVIATLTAFGIQVTEHPTLRLVIGTVVLQGVTFWGVAIAYLYVRDLGSEFAAFKAPTARDATVTLVGTVAIFGLLAMTSAAISALGLESAQNQIMETGQQNPTAFLLLIPLSFLVVGPGEELLYRGLVQGTLRESLHPTRAIVLASVLFASIHLFSLSGEGKLVYIGIAFILALVLGAAYEYTGNLTVPAVIHGTYNAVQFGIAYLGSTGVL